jgi:hypothetical protein
MIRYDDHAEFQLARRKIAKEWVETAINEPEATEITGDRRSFLCSGTADHATCRDSIR